MLLIFASLIILLLENVHAYSYSYSYSYNYDLTKLFTCLIINNNMCTQWKITGTLALQTPSCFPQDTTVKTIYGYKKMKQLVVGDKILSYNPKSQENEYVQVMAWLHRDTEKKFKYVAIQNTQSKIKIHSSEFHNIAVLQNNRLSYEFGKNLLHKSIISAEKQSFEVLSLQKQIQTGIYAPYTSNANFYISNQLNNEQLFLVHTFAHITNPQNYQFIFYYSMIIGQFLGYNIQPNPEQKQYRHPITQIFQKVFPELIKRQQKNSVYFQNPEYQFTVEDSNIAATYNNQKQQIDRHAQVDFILSYVLQIPLLSTA